MFTGVTCTDGRSEPDVCLPKPLRIHPVLANEVMEGWSAAWLVDSAGDCHWIE